MSTIKIKKKAFMELYNVACSGWQTKFEEKFKKFIFKDEVEFEKSFLKEMQKACDDKQLKIFTKLFGKFLEEETTIYSGIIDYISFCKKAKVDPIGLGDIAQTKLFSNPLKALKEARIQQVEKYFNDNWKVNVKDPNQNRYYPYFQVTSSGLVFCGSFYCFCAYFLGQVGFYPTREISDFVGRTFIKDIYELY